ncbi:hypothetical protein CCACVL1_24394 [Corchorus capsularis]|uniref:Uncharacterized protein n=1 Tax=Corchorus capsularis TaxID=210143 RepID=A0A1R3GPZ6_COCAP|nr:hypothetical protein CCACVL1_24394 [Corchorus capsularis]
MAIKLSMEPPGLQAPAGRQSQPYPNSLVGSIVNRPPMQSPRHVSVEQWAAARAG